MFHSSEDMSLLTKSTDPAQNWLASNKYPLISELAKTGLSSIRV